MIRLSTHPACLIALMLLGHLCGCRSEAEIIARHRQRDHVLLVAGIAGWGRDLVDVRRALREAGLKSVIEIVPWRAQPFLTFPPIHSLWNLIDLPANRKRADEIAARITELRRNEPDGKIILAGFSGGGALAVFSLERLPQDVQVDRAILVAPAISKDYALSGALEHCKDRLISFYSERDGIVGWGTALFGTIDRKATVSAGHCGFLDADGELRKHDKLLQIAWDSRWRRYGHRGGHIGYLSVSWAKNVLAPLIDSDGLARADSE